MNRKKFYITTALPYVNSAPHIGFALEIVQADVIARYHRMLKEDVFFLTGTDENSLKNVQTAKKEGIKVKELVDRNAKRFYALKDCLNLSFDDFIRTTEERHIKGAQKLWLACEKDIYKKRYKGLYCVGCEAFYKESELQNSLCPEHKTRPEIVEEENYFFRLSKYQRQLKHIIETEQVKIIPQVRKNETLSFIDSGLEDFSISRSVKRAQGWGIPVPGDSSQIQYVWFDALSNYINALGYAENKDNFRRYWPADVHCIGKGILRFHTVYWLAILLSAGLSLPKTIFVHGYITVNGQKMSKSLGNVVDPFKLVEKYGADAVRYFLLREIPPVEDGDYTPEKFKVRYNADLAGGLGNLVARVIKMAEKINPKFRIQSTLDKSQNPKVKEIINKVQQKYKQALKEFRFNEALISIWELISFCDKYIERQRPWEFLSQVQSSKLKAQKLEEVLFNLLISIKEVALMLQPFLPETSERILKQIEGDFRRSRKSKPLFPRI